MNPSRTILEETICSYYDSSWWMLKNYRIWKGSPEKASPSPGDPYPQGGNCGITDNR